MADNILRVLITADGKQLTETLNRLSATVRVSEAQFRKSGQVIAESLQNSFARAGVSASELNRNVTQTPGLIQRTGSASVGLADSFKKFGSSVNGVLSPLRIMANIIPGLGISGLILGIGRLGASLFGAKKEVKETSDSLSDLGNNLASQAVKLTTLVGVVQNVNTSYSNKQKALKAINQEYKSYIDNLGIEEVTLKNIASSYDKIIDSIIRQAVVKGLQEEITKQVEETARKIIELQIAQEKARLKDIKTTEDQAKIQEQLNNKQEGITNKLTDRLERERGVKLDGVFANEQLRQSQVEVINSTINYDERVKGLTEKLKLQLAPLLNLVTNFGDLNIKLNESKSSVERLGESLGDIGDVLKALDFDLELKPVVDPTQLSTEINNALASRGGAKVEVDADIRINPVLQKAKEDINRAIQDLAVESLSSFGDILGAALTGSDVGGAFKAFIGIVASGLTAIGKQMIILSPVIASLKAALKTLNPAVLLPAGVALVAIGAALRNSVGKGVEFRALGGPVSGRNPYVVGERGPELFIPSVSGSIIPNDRLGTVKSGSFGNWSGEVVFRIGNNELIGTLSKGQRSQNLLV